MLTSVLGHRRHQQLQELSPGQRVETGHRLVQDEQLGSFRDGQGQGQLGALATGQLPGALVGIEAELADAAPGCLIVPVRVEPPAQPQMVGD